MQMDIHAQPFKLTTAIQQHVAQRVEHAIGMASKSVRGVMVRLLDVNGERGGVDMRWEGSGEACGRSRRHWLVLLRTRRAGRSRAATRCRTSSGFRRSHRGGSDSPGGWRGPPRPP